MEKILIIDDSRVQAEALKRILENDFEITINDTAAKGLESAKSGSYSLILLDIVMPNMDGFAVLEELQATSLTRHIPVIMITNLSDAHHEEKGLMMGAVDYITKPFEPLVVKARIHTHIKLYRYQMHFKKQAMIDDLTNIPNRRSYNKNSREKWREAITLKLPFSVCILDIDYFKIYNDTFGHAAGDKVLTAVAQVISSSLHRATDFCARYGGEEFSVILLENDPWSAFNFLTKIRQAVEFLRIPHKSPVSPWVTVSVGGITLTPKTGAVYETYAKIADDMLYDAKAHGRNMVVWTDESKEIWREK